MFTFEKHGLLCVYEFPVVWWITGRMKDIPTTHTQKLACLGPSSGNWISKALLLNCPVRPQCLSCRSPLIAPALSE